MTEIKIKINSSDMGSNWDDETDDIREFAEWYELCLTEMYPELSFDVTVGSELNYSNEAGLDCDRAWEKAWSMYLPRP